MGALSLTRENALLLVAVLAVLGRTRGVTAYATAAGCFAIGRHGCWSAAGGAPQLRASAAGFYLTTSQFGSNLYIGNNPRADGSYMSLREGRGSPEFERRRRDGAGRAGHGPDADAGGGLDAIGRRRRWLHSGAARRLAALARCVRCGFW